MPCLQDHHLFTLGGTLAVGGIGWESIQCGTQAQWVREIILILPNGTRVVANNQINREIFMFTLNGLGQTGYIESAVMETILWKPFWKYGVISFSSIEESFAFLKLNFEKLKDPHIETFHGGRLRGEIDLHFNIGKRFFTVEEQQAWDLENFFSQQPSKYMTGEDEIEIPFEIKNMLPYQLWADYSFTSVQLAESFAEAVFSKNQMAMPIKEAFLNESNLMFLAIYVLKPQQLQLPMSLIPPNVSDHVVSVGTYYSTKVVEQTKSIKQKLSNNLEICSVLGGRPYNYGYVPLSQHQAKKIYGNEYEMFEALRKSLRGQNNWIINSNSILTMTSK